MGMLHRDVKVRYERLARLAQILEHFVRHSGGVKIHEAQAFEARQRQEAVEQSTEILLAVEITPPFREILRHEIQFLDPLIQQARASRTIMSLQWERCLPRILGMAQNEQAWRQRR